jgi:hypothetical protein
MTRNSILAIGALVVSQIVWSPTVWAQTEPQSVWSHGTTLDVYAGSATAPSTETRGTLGAAFAWEISHWVSVEGTGTWLVPRQGDEAFAAELKALANLTRPNRVVPFLGAGVGLYRATFDTTRGALPDFYQQRLTDSTFVTHPTFTDPSFVFAGGVNILTGRHFSIRPDLSVRLVTSSSQVYAVTMATVHLTYHFEAHDVVR